MPGSRRWQEAGRGRQAANNASNFKVARKARDEEKRRRWWEGTEGGREGRRCNGIFAIIGGNCPEHWYCPAIWTPIPMDEEEGGGRRREEVGRWGRWNEGRRKEREEGDCWLDSPRPSPGHYIQTHPGWWEEGWREGWSVGEGAIVSHGRCGTYETSEGIME